MPSEVRRYLVYTDRGDVAADFETRVGALAGGDVPDLGDGRKYFLWTDEGERSADLEARLDEIGIALAVDVGVAGQRAAVYTTKGEAAADFEERMALLAAG